MGKYRRESASGKDEQAIRPVLIVSERTLSDYSIALCHILVGLADESIPVGLICPAGCSVESLVPLSVEVIKHPAYQLPLLWLQNRKILLERLDRFAPTVLHCLCENQAAFTRRLSRQLGLPYVMTANSLQKRKQRWLSNSRCAKIVVPAKSIAESITKLYSKLGEKIEQVNVGTFVEEQVCCFNQQREYANLITFFSGENAGSFKQFLNAVKHLAAEGCKFMLVIISQGKAERNLRKMLANASLSESVIVVPRLEPWRSVLAAADIYVRAEACGSFDPMLVEAMSIGNAVAACKGGVDDLIIDNKTAAVFDAKDQTSIYNALRRLLDNREAAGRLARSVQDYLRKKYTVSAMVSATIGVYRKAQQQEAGQINDG